MHHISDLEEDDDEEGEGGITFQVQQSFSEEKKCTVAQPVSGIFLPAVTSAAVPLTGKKHDLFLVYFFSPLSCSQYQIFDNCDNAVFTLFFIKQKERTNKIVKN